MKNINGTCYLKFEYRIKTKLIDVVKFYAKKYLDCQNVIFSNTNNIHIDRVNQYSIYHDLEVTGKYLSDQYIIFMSKVIHV